MRRSSYSMSGMQGFISRDRMLAQNREIQEAEEEGIIIHPSLGIKEILTKDNKVTGLKTKVCLSIRGGDGNFHPEYDDACPSLTLAADNIIVAIGQTVDRTISEDRMRYRKNGNYSG